MVETVAEITKEGAKMDYLAHETTYDAFIRLFKWGTAGCVALMIAMAVGFFGGGGLIGGTIVFVVLTAIFLYLLK